ncbi:MAG: hypothetical protein HFI88_10180 [Lachnospiraceae bacterium]|nr:hypothetical protein [Lachnospiraceae bacterium]
MRLIDADRLNKEIKEKRTWINTLAMLDLVGRQPTIVAGTDERQDICKPEYMGENRGVGCRVGRCRCGNPVRSYQDFCSGCGVRLEWGNCWPGESRG